MENDSPSSAPRGDTNIANLNAGARVKQFAQGENITQIEGYTAEQVQTLLAEIRASFQPKPFDGRSPYVGLASFQEQDADRFFGREKLTQELVARIETARLLVIAGPSGSGKSSLARAGLLHALRNGARAGSENWLYEILTPGRHPLQQLARVVSALAKSTNAGDEIQQRGRADATLLHRWADIALGDQKTRRAILLVDQFEESFTQADQAERAAFFNLLLYAATIENGRVTLVVCTRSDFIGNWAAYPNLNAQLAHGVNQVPPMQPDELVSAIARPALQVGLQIDPALVKQILDDMRAAPGALPLMQFALDDLFQYEKSQGGVIALTLEDYLKRGGLEKALTRHADAEFAKLNDAEKQLARSVFSGLVEIGRGREDTKRTALFDELVPAGADAARVQALVRELADARLITTDEQGGKETVTLAHERLIDAWDWLRKLVDENRDAIALQNEIAQDAQEWETHKRDESYLYRGARLATAQEKLQQNKLVLSGLAQEFLFTSITARRRMIKQRRTLAIGLGFALVLVVWWFFVQPEIWRAQARGESVAVPEGEFLLGAPFANSQRTSTRWMASVGAFKIDKYEVTNSQYELCRQAQVCSPPANRALYEGASKAKLPVVAITLAQAQDYCHWIGRRVPTEFEWEWAAKGEKAWLYPTGNERPDPDRINVNDFETLSSDPNKERRIPVDFTPPDKGGTFGMAGNVSEWTSSPWFPSSARHYTTIEWDGESNPVSDKVIVRGGGWGGTLEQAHSTSYLPTDPTLPAIYIGFRCVEGKPTITLQPSP